MEPVTFYGAIPHEITFNVRYSIHLYSPDATSIAWSETEITTTKKKRKKHIITVILHTSSNELKIRNDVVLPRIIIVIRSRFMHTNWTARLTAYGALLDSTLSTATRAYTAQLYCRRVFLPEFPMRQRAFYSKFRTDHSQRFCDE